MEKQGNNTDSKVEERSSKKTQSSTDRDERRMSDMEINSSPAASTSSNTKGENTMKRKFVESPSCNSDRKKIKKEFVEEDVSRRLPAPFIKVLKDNRNLREALREKYKRYQLLGKRSCSEEIQKEFGMIPVGGKTYVIGKKTPIGGNPTVAQGKPTAASQAVLGKSAAALGRPAAALGKPAAAFIKPTAALGKPAAALRKPTAVQGKPPAALEKPPAALEKPPAALEKPPAALGKPIASLGKPPAALGKPSAALGKPPAALGKPPAALGKSPAALGNKPTAAQKKPTTLPGKPLPVPGKPTATLGNHTTALGEPTAALGKPTTSSAQKKSTTVQGKPAAANSKSPSTLKLLRTTEALMKNFLSRADQAEVNHKNVSKPKPKDFSTSLLQVSQVASTSENSQAKFDNFNSLADESYLRMGEELTCPVCLELYNTPIMLPCSHSLCKQCLESLALSRERNRLEGVECPSCRKVLKITSKQVVRLPENRALKNTIFHYQQVALHHQQRQARNKEETTQYCKDHREEKVVMFCDQCQLLVCHLCLCEGQGQHIGHKVMSKDSAASQIKEKVKLTLSTLEPLMNTVQERSKKIKDLCSDVENAHTRACKQVEDQYLAVLKELQKKKEMFVQTLTLEKTKAVTNLKQHEKQTQSTLTDMDGLVSSCRNMLQKSNIVELLTKSSEVMPHSGKIQEIEERIQKTESEFLEVMTNNLVHKKFTETVDKFETAFRDCVKSLSRRVDGPCTDVTQYFHEVLREQKRYKLCDILSESVPEKTVVFLEQKRNVDFIATFLAQSGFPTTCIHGGLLQEEREEALRDFKTGRIPVLVATHDAAHGLDFTLVKHVINYDLPQSIDEYVHRIGFTGRCGNVGKSTSFYHHDSDSKIVKDLLRIMKEAQQEIPHWLEEYARSSQNTAWFSNYGSKF